MLSKKNINIFFFTCSTQQIVKCLANHTTVSMTHDNVPSLLPQILDTYWCHIIDKGWNVLQCSRDIAYQYRYHITAKGWNVFQSYRDKYIPCN